jgi:long-chain fatty acid transport protein
MTGDSKERIYLPFNDGFAHLYMDPQANAYQLEVDSAFKGAPISKTGEFEVEMKLPSEFGVGIAYHPNEKTIVSADLVYTRWSEFQDFQIKFKNRPLSQDYYARWDAMFTDVTVPFQWKDKIKISVGLEKILNERWTYRGGYMFDQSPVPDETFSQLFLDTGTKHHFNAGAGFKLNERVSFDAALELVVFSSRTISTLTDVNDDQYWDNFGGEFKNLSFNSTWALNYRF